MAAPFRAALNGRKKAVLLQDCQADFGLFFRQSGKDGKVFDRQIVDFGCRRVRGVNQYEVDETGGRAEPSGEAVPNESASNAEMIAAIEIIAFVHGRSSK